MKITSMSSSKTSPKIQIYLNTYCDNFSTRQNHPITKRTKPSNLNGIRGVSLTAELLRVYSPSADYKNLGDSPPVFESGKSSVQINKISKVGNYAIKFLFDDGHDDGIYSWDYLKNLHKTKLITGIPMSTLLRQMEAHG